MKYLLLLCLLLPIPNSAAEYSASPVQETAKIEADILNGKLAQRTEQALNTIFSVAEGELRKRGHEKEAYDLQMEWADKYRSEFHRFAESMGRDIGDHPDQIFSKWLDDKIDMLIFLLGMDVMKATHLIDLKVFNDTPKIVFRPCTFNMGSITIPRNEEYKNHFSYGEELYGLVPVTTYWVVYGVVTAASSGTGFVFFSGIIASGAEKLISFVTPKLSDTVFHKACGG